MSEEIARELLNEINRIEDNMNLLNQYKPSEKDKPLIEKLFRELIKEKNEIEKEIRILYANKDLF